MPSRAALGAAARDRLLLGAAIGIEGLGSGQPTGEDRAPFARRGQRLHDPFCGDVGLGAGEVEEEGGPGLATGHRDGQPWISQPSAARAASMTASESVGWPWMMRATSAKPPST